MATVVRSISGSLSRTASHTPMWSSPLASDPRPKRGWVAFLTGAPDDGPPPEQTRPPSSATDAPRFPEAGTRRPVTRVARPVSSAPPQAPATPVMVQPDGTPSVPTALPDHMAPPGAVIVAGVDSDGIEYVLEDDPEAEPLVDPRYDYDDRNWVRYRTSRGGFLRFVALVLVTIFLFTNIRGRIYSWVDDQIIPGGQQGEAVALTIPDGASTNNVATQLANEGIISNATVFRYWLRCEGELTITGFMGCETEKTFQAGEYELYENMAFEDAVAILDEGPIPEVFFSFNIPEGLRLEEIINRLLVVNEHFEEQQIRDALQNPNLVSQYVDPDAPPDFRLEGTLFPATYDINEDDLADEARFLRRMADTFDARYGALLDEVGYDPAAVELGLTDWDIIVIASMIEEEARVDVDRPLMSRAIYNRLLEGTKLQIDATVYYAVNKSFTDVLFQSDLDFESPWNTYVSEGIPPSPIAAPGEAALRAALDPAEGDYIFWARTDANGLGSHTFSVTYEEHLDAVEICTDLGYC